jgi:hypothetical protein
MKNIILAWLNANATNEAKAKEIEYHCEKFTIEFCKWYETFFEDNGYTYSELIEIYKKQKENE